MNYLTNYYKNLSEQLQERVDYLKKLLSESEITAREMTYSDYENLIKHLKSKGAPASKIAEVEADMIADAKRHGINLERPNTSSGKTATSTAANAAKGIGAGVVGALAGEYIVKPAAEKAGVFDAVEKGSRAILSQMPDWSVNVADKALGAAQFALDPMSSIAPAMQQGLEAKTQREVDSMIKAGKPSQVRVSGSKL